MKGVVAGEHCASPELLGPAMQTTGGHRKGTAGFLRLPRVDLRWLGGAGWTRGTTATSLAGTEVRGGRGPGFRARLELGLGVFEIWENREPNARTEASTGALERGGRWQWRLQSSAL